MIPSSDSITIVPRFSTLKADSTMKPVTTVCGLVLFLVSVGCRKSTPVDEVSLAESGVKVSDHAASQNVGPWPQWRGPRGDGVAVDQNPPTEWGATENVLWRTEVPGRGHSSPIVVGELVVIGTAVESDATQRVLAYDRTGGELMWNTVVHEGGLPNPREVHQKATHANSTLVCDGQRLITAHLNRERVVVTALDLQGEQLWQTDVGAFASKFGYAPSPALYQSLVIVAADNFGGGYLAALDLESGEVAWRKARGDASSYSSPHVATVGGVDQVLLAGGDRVASYDPATGELLWETPCIAESTCGTVVTSEDRIFASGGYPEAETVCLAADGKPIWSEKTKVYEPSPVTDGKQVYAVTDNGIAICWSSDDGAVLWRKRLGGNFSSSPVIANGHVYVADLSGKAYVFEASGEAFKLIATNPLGDDCYASPAVADDCLFFRVGAGQGTGRTERLICIGRSTPDA